VGCDLVLGLDIIEERILFLIFAIKAFANHCEKIHIGDFGDVNRNLLAIDKISLVFVEDEIRDSRYEKNGNG